MTQKVSFSGDNVIENMPSPSDGLVSYPGHSLGEREDLNPLQRCNWYILQPLPTALGHERYFIAVKSESINRKDNHEEFKSA